MKQNLCRQSLLLLCILTTLLPVQAAATDIASAAITGAERMTFGPTTAQAFSNPYTVTLTDADGTTLSAEALSKETTDFKVVWDIEGFKSVNDTENQYCDSYGSFSVNGQASLQTTFDLRDVPMNFYGRMTATVICNGKTIVASKYVVALGNQTVKDTQVLPLGGYPVDFNTYPDALTGYTVAKETYGKTSDLILGGWCVAGSDNGASAKLQKDADGTKYVRITSTLTKKSHVMTQSIASPSGQLIFRTLLRFNSAGAVLTLTGGNPFWLSKGYTCPVTLLYNGSQLTLNSTPLQQNGAAVQITKGKWYQVVLSADKSSELCYAYIYDLEGKQLGESGTIAWTEASDPAYFNIAMDNSNVGYVDVASCEAFVPTPDADSFKLAADKTVLSTSQEETAQLSVTINDGYGYPLTGKAEWTVVEEDMRQSVIITPDASDSHKATVKLSSTAEAGTATIQVSIGGATKTLQLSLTSSAESVKFTQSTTSITIPMEAKSVTYTFAASVFSADGTDTGIAAMLAAYEKDGVTPFASNLGIAFDAPEGRLTVRSSAAPTVLVIRAMAQNKDGQELSKSIKVNIHGMKFDFGNAGEDSEAEGYTVVTPQTIYNATTGYGLKANKATVAGTPSTTNAKSDYIQGAVEFDFKVSKGEFYQVEVTYQGKLTTGYINSDLAGYELGTHTSMTTESYVLPATTDLVQLRIADADATHVARLAQVTVIKQAKRQKRAKAVVHHIGDSTSANRGSWAHRLDQLFGSTYSELVALCNFQNNGRGGRNLSTYYTQGLLANVLKDIYPGDILMLGNMGTNGMGNAFESDVNYYLNAAEALGAQIIINSYSPHGAVSKYANGYNASTHKFNSYRKDSYDAIVRKVAQQRQKNDANYLGFVEIGKNADAAFNAYVTDYAKNGHASADAAAKAIIDCFTDHNHYSNGTLACDLMLNGYGDVKGIVAQLVEILGNRTPDTPTAVTTVEVAGADDTYFTLSGQQVDTPLRPGLYVTNGRKVIIK